jgi:tryptophan-rich sensory protein
MAVINTTVAQENWSIDLGRSEIPALFFAAALPVLLFVGLNFVANYFGIYPLFFAPFGLPGWLGASVHIASLPMFGVAGWLTWRAGGQGRQAAAWSFALVLGTAAFPFVVGPLDSLMLSIISMSLLLIGIVAAGRAAAVSPVAALLMAPALLWIGFSAFMGLSLVASWAPPFGLTNTPQGAS